VVRSRLALCARARAGAIVNFMGINAPNEPSPTRDLVLQTANGSTEFAR
jgi:adenylylsulfate kinase-like enzyme